MFPTREENSPAGKGNAKVTYNDSTRWAFVTNRTSPADDSFVYAVKTTGIYCRPSCPSRSAKRENVTFYDTPAKAEASGYRACQRCNPKGRSIEEANRRAVAIACRQIEEADAPLRLEQLAAAAGMSAFHFHRLFKSIMGLTPKAYAAAHQVKKVRTELSDKNSSVARAIYGAGYNSNSRFYEKSNEVLGMTPTEYKQGGQGVDIRFAVGQCSLGAILVAQSAKGICAISLGDDPAELVRELEDCFPNANLIGGDVGFEKLVAQVVGFVEKPGLGLNLPLDVRGTAFQQRVWKELQAIPTGRTASYADIADRIGQPTATRAVAQACGANKIAVAIPCHRVVRADGSLSGYRWGVERKAALIDREARS